MKASAQDIWLKSVELWVIIIYALGSADEKFDV